MAVLSSLDLTPELLALATPAELKALELALIREKALLSPLDYAIYTSDGRTKPYEHTKLLSLFAKAVTEHALYDDGIGPPAVWVPAEDDPEDGAWRHPERGDVAHSILVVSCPPQHGKSWIITEIVPAWYLTKNPHNRVIVTGYEADFAKDFGRANRNKIQEHPELGVSVSRSTQAADNWSLEGFDGKLVTAGSGGGISGKRCELLVCDDPVKDAKDALSEVERTTNINWWKSVIKARIRTDTVVIIIQTRWHENDLAGHVIANERCFNLNLPALAFDGVDSEGYSVDPDTGVRDWLNRKPGEALCPALQTRSMLQGKRVEIGEQWFSAQYQGKANIEGGGYLAKPFYYFTSEVNFSGKRFFRTKDSTGQVRESYASDCIYFVTADLAVSTKNTADYTVFTLFAWTPYNQLLVVDIYRERVESTEHMAKAKEFWKRARTLSGGAGIRFFGVESKTFGLSLIQALRKDREIPVKKLDADADKIARAIPVGMAIRQDEFFLPAGHDMLVEAEKEMMIFPNGTHDDIVDTFGYGVREMRLLPRRDLSAPASGPERVERERRKRRRHHPIIGRMP